MSKIKNHYLDTPVKKGNKWVSSFCFFLLKKLARRKIRVIKGVDKKPSANLKTKTIDLEIREFIIRVENKERERITFSKSLNYEDIKENVKDWEKLEKRRVKKLGVFQLGTEKGKKLYFNARYLGFILYMLGKDESFLLSNCYYYPDYDVLLIYNDRNKAIAGLMRLKVDETKNLSLLKSNYEFTDYAGIDYGMGNTNVDIKNHIRFSCISQNTVGQAWFDDSEAYYPCDECEYNPDKETDEDEDEDGNNSENEDDFNYCDCCEPSSWYYEEKGYSLESAFDNTGIIVTKSPYFTYAQFCSPCFPGGCDLDSPLEKSDPNNKCYCLGHDWFEDGKAPYPVYDVKTGQLVNP